jgi:hypothetical protein
MRFLRTLLLLPLLHAGSAFGSQKDKPPASYNIPLPPRPDFSAFGWLIGDWAGHTADAVSGKETQGDVHLTIAYTLDKRFLLVHEDISLPAGRTAPSVHEAWTGFLSADPFGPDFILRVFSSTGFMTQYHVTVRDGLVRFDPQGGANPPPGFLFRRAISRLAPGFFDEKVEVAPPGGSFFPYYDAKLTQVLEAKPSSPAVTPQPPPTTSSAPSQNGSR